MKSKNLHYCWFGGNPKSDVIKKCIESWKKYCPNYEIIEWNENNFDVNCCDYVRGAYQARKWAFVSDYCRFWILYNYGGVYLDTDVELIKPINNLPYTFVGFENKMVVASGLIRGALPNDEICKLMLESYHADKFINEKGELNLKTVCERETEIFESFGLKQNGKLQMVNGTTVYPVEYFAPKDYITGELNITENTVSIHHYDASWYNDIDKLAVVLRKKYSKFLPKKLALRVASFVAVKRIQGLKVAIKKTLSFFKRKK